MSNEPRRAPTVPATHVSLRMCFTIIMFIGVLCLSGGYVLGNMAHNEARKSTEIITNNITVAWEVLFRKAKRLTKAMKQHDPSDKITAKLLEIFHCECMDCGKMKDNNVFEFTRTLVNNELARVIKSIHNATHYIDTLRLR